MKVIINNAEMVPTPKKGTIIRFGDCGLFVIGIYVGRSDDNGYMVVVLQHNATPPGDAPTATGGGSWRGNDNKFLWTSATDDVFRDCFIPTTTI